MACSFLKESVDIEAKILCCARRHLDVFLFPDQYLLIFLFFCTTDNLFHAPSSEEIFCTALHFFLKWFCILYWWL